MPKPKFIFSLHALYKFGFFKKHRVLIRINDIKRTVLEGKTTDKRELPKLEVTKEFDENHSLVVIYRKIDTIFFIITFWIAEKGRYERKIQ